MPDNFWTLVYIYIIEQKTRAATFQHTTAQKQIKLDFLLSQKDSK